ARRRMLQQLGYLSIDVATATDVLGTARRARPTAILLDVHLPDGDGRDVCRTLCADGAVADTPVILISATLGALDNVDLARTGACAFVREPVSPQQLSTLLQRAINGE